MKLTPPVILKDEPKYLIRDRRAMDQIIKH